MPSYEPTPRRFSIVSVSRNSSRRNSTDEFRPSLAYEPPPTPSHAVDLAGALKHLQHVPDTAEAEDGGERGRSRQSMGERAIRSTWGHDEPIKVPAARRESSASTRDRIAQWEERSRSQSKGRSKSRGRDLGPGSRISVVPEVPEIAAAFAQLQGEAEAGRKNKPSHLSELQTMDDAEMPQQPRDELVQAQGGGTRELGFTSITPYDEQREIQNKSKKFFEPVFVESEELMADPWNLDAVQPEGGGSIEAVEDDQVSWEEDGGADDDLPDLESDGADAGGRPSQSAPIQQQPEEKQRPQTPVRVSPEFLPTPETTPQPVRRGHETKPSRASSTTPKIASAGIEENSTDERVAFVDNMIAKEDEDGVRLTTPIQAPSTPVRAAAIPNPPLTPEATPESSIRRTKSPINMAFGGELTPTTPRNALQAAATSARPESPVAEPTYRRIDPQEDKDWDDEVPEEHFHLPSDLLSETATGGRANQRPKKVPSPSTPDHEPAPNPRVPRPAEKLEPRNDPQARYHKVWRIQDYEPEFPVPAKPSAQPEAMEMETLAKASLSGNPLNKKLPRSQLSAEAEPYQPLARQATAPYPYPSKSRAAGDWAVNIPPSPTATYVPPSVDPRHRPARPRSRSRSRARGEERGRYTGRGPDKHEWDAPPVIERALHAASVSVIQGLTVPVELYRGLRDTYYPPPGRPDIVKAYPVRRRLPVRIFFPSHHDLTSPALLPTLFTIHGGGFTVGSAADDDAWNRSFSDSYTVLVIALNYGKAPWAVFPTPLLDAEALYHAALNDESLPIDRMRTALCGFDAGGNLALALAQLPSVRTGYDPSGHAAHAREYTTHPYPHQPPRSHPPPAGVVSVCGILDFSTTAARKARTRPYKRQLRGPRGWGPGLDWMARMLPSSAWSYIPYGHDVADPLLSPAYAGRAELPPHVFVIAAELDCLAHESWRTACAWAGRAVPDADVLVGRRGPSRWRGCLDDGRGENGVKFGWSETHARSGAGGSVPGSTRWLLVPDVVHGFDSPGWRNKYLWGDEEARMDSEMKTIAYQRELAEWLWGTVWR